MDIISKAILLLGVDNDVKPTIKVLYEICLAEFKEYCNRDDIPTTAEPVILNMILVQYNRLGAQGLSSLSYSGISEAYTDGYPLNIIKLLNRYRKLKVI